MRDPQRPAAGPEPQHPAAGPDRWGAVGVLGVDVGGTKVALRAEAAGRPAYDRTFRWPHGADAAADLAALAAEVTRLRDAWG
ncbi:hypothetical protein ABT351_26525, partial [Micromonospora sp. NPDC000018]